MITKTLFRRSGLFLLRVHGLDKNPYG